MSLTEVTVAREPRRRAKRLPPLGSDGTARVAPRPSIRVLDLRTDGSSVIEVRVSLAMNPILRVFRALSALGLQLVETRVLPSAGSVVQRLYLLERDGSSLDESRLSQALVALVGALAAV